MEALLKKLEDRLLSDADGALGPADGELMELGEDFLDAISASHKSSFGSTHTSCAPPSCS